MNTPAPLPRGSPDQTGINTPGATNTPVTTARKALVNAALTNHDILAYLADPHLGRIWTEEAIHRCPVCKNEWEYVTVIATTGEAHSAAKHKNWGRFLGVFPLARDDPVHPYRIVYMYKQASPYNRRVEQRRELKRILGKGHRSLVIKASRSTKKDFLRTLTPADVYAIRLRLKLDPGRFWRVAKGKEFVEFPKRPRQLTLFDDFPEDGQPDAGATPAADTGT